MAEGKNRSKGLSAHNNLLFVRNSNPESAKIFIRNCSDVRTLFPTFVHPKTKYQRKRSNTHEKCYNSQMPPLFLHPKIRTCFISPYAFVRNHRKCLASSIFPRMNQQEMFELPPAHLQETLIKFERVSISPRMIYGFH